MSPVATNTTPGQLFVQTFGTKPRWIASAPGRVNLIGEHTDYNDGFVLPMAIEHRTTIFAAATDDNIVTLRSTTAEDPASFSLTGELSRGEPAWSNYVRGVIAGFQALNYPVKGFNAVIDSQVPIGSGLSSSAALEVASATLLEGIIGKSLDPVQKALLCQEAEHEYAGVPCGIMDQFISVMGRKDHLLLIDCRAQKAELVPFNDASLSVLIINTNVRHSLADGEYGKRRAQCELAAKALRVPALRDATIAILESAKTSIDPLIYRRARHVITENLRTVDAAKQLRAGNWEHVGNLMYESHASLRDDYEVSCKELDLVVDLACQIGPRGGVLGCRMTGGGFGGCAVALIRTPLAEDIQKSISHAYLAKTGKQAGIFLSRPGAGAAIASNS